MQHFAIIAMPRSGSTRLCDVLARHPAVACHLEIFHPAEVQAHLPRDLGLDVMDCAFRDANPKLFLDKFLAFNETWYPGRQRHGFKVMLDRNQLKAVVELICPDPRFKKIVLYRENLLACYLSVELALATGLWHRVDGADTTAAQEEHKIDFDWDGFFALAGEQLLTRAAVEQVMHQGHQRFLPIAYEETLTQRGMDRIWDFLDIPAIADEGIYRKSNARRLLDCFKDPKAVTLAAKSIGRPDWLEE